MQSKNKINSRILWWALQLRLHFHAAIVTVTVYFRHCFNCFTLFGTNRISLKPKSILYSTLKHNHVLLALVRHAYNRSQLNFGVRCHQQVKFKLTAWEFILFWWLRILLITRPWSSYRINNKTVINVNTLCTYFVSSIIDYLKHFHQ